MPYTVSIAPTKSHTEQYLSSSHPDRRLYAMLAFIVEYAWSRMLCATAARLRTVVRVSGFRFFCSYLVLSASDRRPPLLYTYTQQQILTPSVISSLPSEALPRVTRMDPSPPSASSTYLSVIFFFNRLFVWYVFMWCDISASRRDSAIYSCKPVALGLGNAVHGHCCNLMSFVAKTENVLDGGTCEHLSMTLLLVRCRPEIISIRTSPTLFTVALLSCPG